MNEQEARKERMQESQKRINELQKKLKELSKNPVYITVKDLEEDVFMNGFLSGEGYFGA